MTVFRIIAVTTIVAILRYMSADFVARYEAGRRAKADSQRQREADQL